MKAITIILGVLVAIVGSLIQPASAQQSPLWCLDEASGGYVTDPNVPVGRDKSRPLAFFASRFPLAFDGATATINLQGLREENLACTPKTSSVFQCVGEFKMLVFDKETLRFSMAQVEGHVADNKGPLSVRFGQCR
jgi:hypothetical protein